MVRPTLLFVAALAIMAADNPPPGPPAATRYPQPVRVGDVLGRDVLQPIEAQPVLGRVRAIVREPGGALELVMTQGGILGIGARQVVVPLDATALMGEYVALMDLSPVQLGELPDKPVKTPTDVPLAPDSTIRMGIVRPFH